MYESAYGDVINNAHVVHLKRMNNSDQLEYIKELWQTDSTGYLEWKKWCIQSECLPELFGTKENPIPIDESSL